MAQSVYQKINTQVLNTSNSDKIWSYSDFQDLPFIRVAKAFSTLSQKGILKRAEKGFYYRPKMTILGEAPPDFLNILNLKLKKKNSFYCISGLSGYNSIGLTTQVPFVTTIACDVKITSQHDTNNKFRFIYRKKPHSGTALERIILDAIIDIDIIPDTTPSKTIKKIKDLIMQRKISIDDLAISALSETARVRAIIGALGQELTMKPELMQSLKKSLNPSTSYFINILDVLKYSKEWNIKVTKR